MGAQGSSGRRVPGGWGPLGSSVGSWVERVYPNLVHYNRVEKGGHFAAWEPPELFAHEMRTAFRSLR